MSKFKVGDRVRVTSDVHNKGVIGTVTSTNCGIVHFTYRSGVTTVNDWWHEDRFQLVTEGGDMDKPYQRKTYKLLKAMPGYAAGTLFQEQCDDGTQPYSVISEPGRDPYYEVRLEFKKRSYVEDNPKWFAEVFQVEPQYMTREELDQWEAFKSRKKPGRKAAPKLTAEKVDEWRSKPHKRRVSAKERNRRSEAMKAAWARRKAQKAA